MKNLPLVLLLCLALSGCTPSAIDTTSSNSTSVSTPESSSSSSQEQSSVTINEMDLSISDSVTIRPGECAWFSFTNGSDKGDAYGFLSVNKKELIFEPFFNYVSDSSSEEALGPARTGMAGEQHFYYFDIYLDVGETFYIRIKPKNDEKLSVVLDCNYAESMEEYWKDSDGNLFLKGLHCHTYGYYRAKDSQYHMNSCWKNDSTLSVEPHRFGEPKTVDSIEVVTCLDCGYTKQVSETETSIIDNNHYWGGQE